MAKIADIIKYEGDNSTFIWKHPCEDFNSLTQLIVHESQEAVFFMNGEALDVFQAGRHTLETQNIPLIGKALNRATDDQTPFHCEVYFINQTVQMDLKWGTDSKVRYLEPEYGIPLELGASGSMNLRVSNGLKLLVKLVGTMNGIAWGESGANFTKSLQNSFRPMISTAVKSNLTAAIKENNINILEIDEHLTELSATLKNKIIPGFEEYGLTVPEFYLTTVVLPEENPNFKRIRELHTISLQTKMAQAEAQVRTAQAQAQAQVTAAQREIELEKQTTQTEVAKREAERQVITAKAQAEAARQAGFAQAQVMQAQGYNKKDVIQAEVQKAYAEGIGNMGSGGGAGGSTMSDIVGLGVGLQAAQAMSGQIGGIFSGLNNKQAESNAPAQTVKCTKCGATLPEKAKFCLECGEKVINLTENEIICPSCKAKTPKGKFCMECGSPLVNKCPNCGAEVPAGGKFCLECGTKIGG
ncbi:MAG: SPFH domain-containing protein [Clostridiales bacterium]|nr:SPFH domain-containing protein [Clostridiales bacterium]